jgi:hypothetical protein
MADAPDASTQGKPERRRRTRTHKRRRSRETSIRVICRECGQRHDLHICYCLFPNKAPDGFKAREAVRRMVDQNLKEDHSLAEEAKRIQKSMDKGSFDKGKRKPEGD